MRKGVASWDHPKVRARTILFDYRRSQFQLQTDTRQNIARSITYFDGVVLATVEQLARSTKRFVFGPKIFCAYHAIVAPKSAIDPKVVTIGDSIHHF